MDLIKELKNARRYLRHGVSNTANVPMDNTKITANTHKILRDNKKNITLLLSYVATGIPANVMTTRWIM
jgi:hypothetical protein